jgi:hypothetical protein
MSEDMKAGVAGKVKLKVVGFVSRWVLSVE